MPDVRQCLSLHSKDAFKDNLLEMDNQSLQIVFVTHFIVVAFLKVSLILLLLSPLKSNQYLFIDFCINCNLELLPLHTHPLNNNNNGSK